MTQAVLDETDIAILDIKKDAFDFQREILIGGENSRTGKIEAERIIKYREEKIKQKIAAIKKCQTKKDNLTHTVQKLIAQIKKKDELGDDLKFIDFHQLQIENKKYLKEIEEKNNKLLKSKIATGKTIKQWNDLKKDLNDEMNKKKTLLMNIKKFKALEVETNLKFDEVKKRNLDYTAEHAILREQITKLEKDGTMNITNFISDKSNQSILKQKIFNYQRKIDINTMRFNQAIKFLGIPEEDVALEIEKLEDILSNKNDPGLSGDNIDEKSDKMAIRKKFLTDEELKIIDY